MCSELHVPEKRFALLLGMKLVQRHKFKEAFKVLRRKEDYHLLRKLATMIDENKLVAGGRLSELMTMKHYILPEDSTLTGLIVMDCHLLNQHVGP